MQAEVAFSFLPKTHKLTMECQLKPAPNGYRTSKNKRRLHVASFLGLTEELLEAGVEFVFDFRPPAYNVGEKSAFAQSPTLFTAVRRGKEEVWNGMQGAKRPFVLSAVACLAR